MRVKELIKELKKYPKNLVVAVNDGECGEHEITELRNGWIPRSNLIYFEKNREAFQVILILD